MDFKYYAKRVLFLINLQAQTLGCQQYQSSIEFGSPLLSEAFSSGDREELDILFVVDNSRGMAADQYKLAAGLSSFIATLDSVEWRIGVTTTDVSNHELYGLQGRLLEFGQTGSQVLDSKSSNYETLFLETVVRPETTTCQYDKTYSCASDLQKPLKASLLALTKRNDENRGFFRDLAALAIIYITDSDEATTTMATTAQEVIYEVQAQWSEGSKKFKSYGIIIKPGDEACYSQASGKLAGGGEQFGNAIFELTEMTGGKTASICEADYGVSLKQIGQDARTLFRSFWLRVKPVVSSVAVQFYPPEHEVRWSIDGQQIVFEEILAPQTEVQVTYRAH